MSRQKVFRSLLAAFITGCFVLVTTSPASAHVTESSKTPAWGIVVAVVGAGAALTGIGVSMRGRRNAGLAAFAVGIVLLSIAMTGFSLEPGPRSSPVQVKILEPTWGAKVRSPVTIRVDLLNGTLVPLDRTSGPPTEGHLHIYANGRAVGMFDDLEEAVELQPGRYVIQVEFTGADHKSFSPFVADTVEIEVVSSNA